MSGTTTKPGPGRYGDRYTPGRSYVGSPASMGELITSAEREAAARGWANSTMDNYGWQAADEERNRRGWGGAWDRARKMAERSTYGRMASGHYSSGPKFQGAVWGLASGLARRAQQAGDLASLISFVVSYTDMVLKVPNQYATGIECGSFPAHLNVQVPTFCGSGVFVVQDSTMTDSVSGRYVGVWGPRISDYTPGFGRYPLHKTLIKPKVDPDAVTLRVPDPAPRVQPRPGIFPVPDEGPMSWAKGLERPSREWPDAGNEAASGPNNAPWNNPGIALGSELSPVPLPGTQVVNPPPGVTPVTPNPPPSRPPRRRVKEVKFAGSKTMLRLLKLSLAMTEVIDAIDEIADAIPEKYLRECKRKARKRYWRERKERDKRVDKSSLYGRLTAKKTNWQMKPTEALECIFANAEHIEMDHMFYNLVRNHIEDMWAGWQYGLIDKALRSTRRYGGPVVTRNTFKHDPLELPEWGDPFWGEVEEYLQQKGIM